MAVGNTQSLLCGRSEGVWKETKMKREFKARLKKRSFVLC